MAIQIKQISCKMKALLKTENNFLGGLLMSNNLLIIKNVYNGLSQRSAAQIHHVSRNTVALLVRHAKANGWRTISDLNGIDET